jgi:Domain of unknown function (DUF1844)
MSDRDKPFTVSDRRHFTPEGEPRREEVRPSRPPAAEKPREESPASRPTPPSGAPAEKADFSGFVMSLAGQAVALMAGEGLPEGSSPAEALEGARSIIAILEMLKDKTEGRRTAAEDELLEGLLFELRMGYVAKARVSGA